MSKIRTRFPPEPNGYLHIGHAKAIHKNFNYPFDSDEKAICHLRFDDTNPKSEKQEYVDSIIKDVAWLGYTPDRITYTSDYFDELMEHAMTLIKNGDAYVDFSSGEEIRKQRHEKVESPYRETSIEKNIEDFEKMIDGTYKPNEAILRLKIPPEDRTNDCMIDPIAYRIISEPHYKTGTKYNTYPSYEYSHYIVDSIEGITHSFCTLEFFIRRNLSYWVLDKLELRKPIISETNRLDTNFGILSKRKIKELVDNKTVDGWDDPRLLTISGIRNKGISANLLNLFCAELGFTKNATAKIPEHKLNSVIRNYMNENSPRRMGVLDPLKIELVNVDDSFIIEKPLFPNNPESETITVNVNPKEIFIEKEDFKEEATRKYKRLAPGRCIRLKYIGIIEYLRHSNDVIYCNFYSESEFQKMKLENPRKLWGTIHWISNAINTQLLIAKYDNTLTETNILVDNPLNTDFNLEKYNNEFQFERLGYYRVENDIVKELIPLRDSKKY